MHIRQILASGLSLLLISSPLFGFSDPVLDNEKSVDDKTIDEKSVDDKTFARNSLKSVEEIATSNSHSNTLDDEELALDTSRKTLKNYVEILRAIKNGEKLTVFIDFAKCQSNNQLDRLDLYSPRSVRSLNNEIEFSNFRLTMEAPHYGGMPVLEYTTYSVIGNSVNIDVDYLKPKTYEFLDPNRNSNKMGTQKPALIKCIIDGEQAAFFVN